MGGRWTSAGASRTRATSANGGRNGNRTDANTNGTGSHNRSTGLFINGRNLKKSSLFQTTLSKNLKTFQSIRKKINWVKKGDKEGMQNYFASRIKSGKLDYLSVVTRYPQFKDGIDEILINDGFQDLIV